MVSVDRDADAAVEARIQTGIPLLTNMDISLMMRRR